MNLGDLIDVEAEQEKIEEEEFERGFWKADFDNIATEYTSTFSKGVSSQSCGAILELWEIDEDNTEPGLQNSNNNMLKFATRYTVTSGWKSWDLQDDEEGTSGEGDGWIVKV